MVTYTLPIYFTKNRINKRFLTRIINWPFRSPYSVIALLDRLSIGNLKLALYVLLRRNDRLDWIRVSEESGTVKRDEAGMGPCDARALFFFAREYTTKYYPYPLNTRRYRPAFISLGKLNPFVPGHG